MNFAAGGGFPSTPKDWSLHKAKTHLNFGNQALQNMMETHLNTSTYMAVCLIVAE